MKLSTRQGSLMTALINEFRELDYVELEMLHLIAKKLHHKQSNVERRLRELSELRLIKPKFEDNYIVGYFNNKIK